MPTPRIAAQAAVFAREIYVFGGYSRGKIRGEKDHKTVEVYNTRTIQVKNARHANASSWV